MADRSIDVVKRTTVYKGFVSLEEVELRYEKSNGEMSSLTHRLSVERGDSVAVLLYIRSTQELVFVRQFRYPTLRHGEPWLLEIVAGAIDLGESPEQSALRELQEEVGVSLTELTLIATFFGSPGSLSEKVFLYFASVDSADHSHSDGGLPDEDLEILYKPARAVFQDLIEGKIHEVRPRSL